MIQLFIWFDRHIVRLTYIGINMYMVYSLQSERSDDTVG